MRDDRIAALAYAIWEREGRPHGRHEEHWYQAEREIAAKAAPARTPWTEAEDALLLPYLVRPVELPMTSLRQQLPMRTEAMIRSRLSRVRARTQPTQAKVEPWEPLQKPTRAQLLGKGYGRR